MALATADRRKPKHVKPKSFMTYSVDIEPHRYKQEEWFCRYIPRIHRDAHLADAGSWQCQIDFLGSSSAARADVIRNQAHKSYAVGSINATVGNFTALCLSDALPDRLAMVSYMVEYAYIHDDVIEYAEKKGEQDLAKTNTELTEGLDMNQEAKAGTKDHIRRRQLQAKMAVELIDIDREKGAECLRLWKEMSEVFVKVRDMDFKTLDEYLPVRAIDAGCPWTMSLLRFAMDLDMTESETATVAPVTKAGFDAWVLVNDYFSWDKEWKNFQDNGSKGEIVSAVFLYMKWYSIEGPEAKKKLRSEIIAREKKYEEEKLALLSQGGDTDKLLRWFEICDLITAGNFAWSMTTSRYWLEDDPYKELRKLHQHAETPSTYDALNTPISVKVSEGLRSNIDPDEKVLKPVFAKSPVLVNGDGPPSSREPSKERHGNEDEDESADTDSDRDPDGKAMFQEFHVEFPKSQSAFRAYEQISREPYDYIAEMPSKGVRNSVIDSLDTMYQVPEKSLAIIREIVNSLHNASLMIDDIEDSSSLRRGLPATHKVFGIAQTINSANMIMIKAIKMAGLLSPSAVTITTNRVIDVHIGQGMDLRWTRHTEIPSADEYFAMVDGKTGAVFCLVAELMRAEATANRDVDITSLTQIFGRFFQARDDYQNLKDAQYTKEKGYAEDISEGKVSLPLIYAMNANPKTRSRLLNVLQQRKNGQFLEFEVRKLAVAEMESCGALEVAKGIVLNLQKSVDEMLTEIEHKMESKNWILRLIQKRLQLKDE